MTDKQTLTREELKALRHDATRHAMGRHWIVTIDMALRSLDGFEEGIEAATKVCDEMADDTPDIGVKRDYKWAAKVIRAVAAQSRKDQPTPSDECTDPMCPQVAVRHGHTTPSEAERLADELTAKWGDINSPNYTFQIPSPLAQRIIAALRAGRK